jgi:hypothetical protein
MHQIDRLVRWLRQILCRHEFYTNELSKDYTPPEMPENLNWWDERKHPAFTQRVCWPCHKCGKKFYSHCGLDIVGSKGKWVAYRAPSNAANSGA